MRKRFLWIAMLAIFFGVTAVAIAGDDGNFKVTAREFDPSHTFLVQSEWLSGIGCPTGAKVEEFIPPNFNTTHIVSYTDPACNTGDQRDKRNEGLLMAKTGPTNNNAAAVADIKGLKKDTALTELGYDLRKPTNANDPRGSHCGAGAPRFDIITKNDVTTPTPTTNQGHTFFIGCNSPPAVQTATGNGWIRLRWGGSPPLMAYSATTGTLVDISGQQVKELAIVFDEGQDAGPDNFGLAVLDNIDVNSVLVGQGDNKKGHGHDDGGDDD
jgi:hypothetical protein